MTSRAEPLRSLHSIVRSRNGKISLLSVRCPAIFRKISGFFFQNFRVFTAKSKIFLPSVRRPAVFGKISVFFSKFSPFHSETVKFFSRQYVVPRFSEKFRGFFFKIFALSQRNGKISLPSVRRPAVFGKISVFFFKIFAFSHSGDAEIPQPSSAPFSDNRELITKYYLKILYCYNFSDAPSPQKFRSNATHIAVTNNFC